jgi:hypothetical protein
MFFWPHLVLTDYEKRFVNAYAGGGKPGVLRRTYVTRLNNTAQAGIPGLENIHLNGQVQISRASRVFALTFSGDIHAWRIKVSTASGTEFTPRMTGGEYPMVCTLSPATSWNFDASADGFQQPDNLTINAIATRQIAWQQLPWIIDPNWELDPNESLLFEGTPQDASALVLEIAVHVWEFPGLIRGMDGPTPGALPRMGGGPSVNTGKSC